jgi:hypothetical protein
LTLQTAYAQYPNIPKAVQDEANARRVAADKRSDEAFAKGLPILKESRGKENPTCPARPSRRICPRQIPAFPGAWGGGMYSFGGRGGKVFVVTTVEDRGRHFSRSVRSRRARIVVSTSRASSS